MPTYVQWDLNPVNKWVNIRVPIRPVETVAEYQLACEKSHYPSLCFDQRTTLALPTPNRLAVASKDSLSCSFIKKAWRLKSIE